ncbi:MAG: class I adenylate-forming enzyme family protein [Novosphingobium sp.]|nr:class I adenylate-forming enzyme family protein [Novosphingobium sp.]
MTATEIDAGDGLPLTIPEVLRHHVAERGDNLMLASDVGCLTYAEAEARSRALAKGFLAAGAGKGTHIGLLLPNGADFIACMLATTRIGAVLVPFSTLSTPAELRQLLTQSDTALLVAADEFRGRNFSEVLSQAFPQLDFAATHPLALAEAPWLRRIWFTGEANSGSHADWSIAALEVMGQSIEDDLLEAAEATVCPADRFVIIHTSGSTGTPKGVIHQHGSLIRHINNCNEIRLLSADTVLFGVSPWFWIAGFGYELMSMLVAGGRIVGSNSQDAPKVLDLLERERPEITNGYYPSVNWLVQHPSFAERDLSFIRRGNLFPILASDVRPPDPSYRHTSYGMSEAGSAMTISADETDLPEHLRNAAGKLCPGYEAKIVDADTGEECAPGVIGELWLRGPFMMEGYYGRQRSEVFTSDGWWKSSDAVAIDAEGYVFLKGRLGNMIKSSFANVAPREVEAVLEELTGRLSIVVGIPDSGLSEAVIGVVFSEYGKEVDEESLRTQLKERLSSYKVPRRIIEYRQDDMPTLSSGKIDMLKLKEEVTRACAQAPA